MTKAKAKGGTGRGTGSKGWTRWKKGEQKAAAGKVFSRKKSAKGAEADKSGSGNANKGTTGTKTSARGSSPFKGRSEISGVRSKSTK